MERLRTLLQQVSTADLRDWAGDTILQRGRRYVTQVAELARTSQGELAALVVGQGLYTTVVFFDDNDMLGGWCSCPCEFVPCKHAVAVILAAAERVRQGEDIPSLQMTHELWALLPEGLSAEGDAHFPDPDDPCGSLAELPPGAGNIRQILAGKSRDDLLALLVELAGAYPEVARRIRETAALETGEVDGIVRSLHWEILEITSPMAWYNPWTREGYLPDYSHVCEQLAALLAKGHADAVMGLGEVIWKRGLDQVAGSQDEGETAIMLADCMALVLPALPQSSRTPPQQLQWLIERIMEDDFDLLVSGDTLLDSEAYTPAHWQVVATWLEKQLAATPVSLNDEYTLNLARSRIVRWLMEAHRRAGWQERIIPLLEQEVHHCGMYTDLVDALLAAGQRAKARQWCIEGMERTRRSWPGIIRSLRERLKKIASRAKKPDLVAAYVAEEYFDYPSRKTYQALQKATEKIGCWPAVRAGVLQFLETGRLPVSSPPGKESEGWPLPPTEVAPADGPARNFSRSFPWFDQLIDLALLEKRLDDVVSLYEAYRKQSPWLRETDEAVAAAVADSHPDVSLGIWRAMAEDLIATVKAKAYDEAAVYLKQMRRLYTRLDRTAEWRAFMAELRLKHKAKRRLMSVLDKLEREQNIR